MDQDCSITTEAELGMLVDRIEMVSRDAAVVRRDKAAIQEHFSCIAKQT